MTIRVHLLLDRYSRGMTMQAFAYAGPQAMADVTICSNRHFSQRTQRRLEFILHR